MQNSADIPFATDWSMFCQLEFLMKKIIFGVLLTPTLAIASNSTELEKVTVTAKGFDNSLATSLRDYEVIQVNGLAGQYPSLASLLNEVTGISSSSMSNPILRQTFSFDGLSLDKTLVLLNGKKIGSATLGEASIQNIPVEQIERIEIMKGNGSVLYGAAAISGVINIVTKQENTTKVYASSASQETVSNGFQHSQQIGEWIDTGINWHYEKSVGSTAREGNWSSWGNSGTFDDDKDGFENHALSAYANLKPTNGLEFNNSFFRSTGTYEYDPTSGDDQSTFKNTQLNSEVRYSVGQLSTSIQASRQTDLSANYGVDNTRKDADQLITITDSVHAQALYQFNRFELQTGAEWQNDYVGSSKLSSDYEKENIVNRSIFAVSTVQLHDYLKLSAGSRRDTTNAYGTHLTYNVSAQTSANGHTVTISQQSGYQTPTFNDLYWPGQGNPDLQPEVSKTKFIKYNFSTNDTSIDLKVLRTDLKDQIAWAPNASGTWEPSNINSSNVESTQINWHQSWSDMISTDLGTEKTIAINQEDDQYLALVPEYATSFKLNLSNRHISTFAKANFIGSRLDSARKERLAPYTTFDLGVTSKPTKELTVSLLGSNILDRDYTPNSSYVNAPATIKATAAYQF